MASIPLGWMQLKHQKLRSTVAVAGITFAVTLILMQLGFRASLFESAVRYQERLNYDIALFNKNSMFIVNPQSFSIRRLYQALGVAGVAWVSPVYIEPAVWKNPYTHKARAIFAIGIDPADDPLPAPGVRENAEKIRQRDAILFDAKSRPEHGPIAERLRAGERIVTEVNDREVEVVGLFEMGTSFGIDASLLTSTDNFLRLFPLRQRTQIDVGLVKLHPGVDPEAIKSHLQELLPEDVLVMTKADFMARERAYWDATTPIGYVFAFGSLMGFIVGAIIVYQILFADVLEHLAEYATVKAMGYSNWYVSGAVIQQAVILALLGYVPGALLSMYLYRTAGEATRLPIYMTPERAALVLALTILMCGISGFLALRKVRSLDPAEIF